MNVSQDQLHILRHSIGLDDNGHVRAYRNYYCDAPDAPKIISLVEMGLMVRGRKINEGKDQYFHVTEQGKTVARSNVTKARRLTKSQRRYQAFLRLDIGCSFKDFLTSPAFADLRSRC